MKKITALLISTALLLSLTGCNSTSTPNVPMINIGDVSDKNNSSSANSQSTQSSQPVQSIPETSTNSTPVSSVTTSNPRPDTSGSEYGGMISGAVIVDATGRGMPIFGGGTGATYAKAVNEVKEKVGANVNVFSMIVPTQGSFYMPENLSMADEWDCIENVNSQLYGIIPVDAYTALSKHTDEEIYARTDHHWMQLGAYYAAEEFVKTAQISVPFTPLSDYDRYDIEGYLGKLYGWSDENAQMAKHPETFTYYIPPNDFATYYMNPTDTDFYRGYMFVDQSLSESYSTFMGGDMKVVHVETDVTNGRKLLIIKDSYPNALVPCLTGSFQEIWTADMRFLDDMENFPHSISQIVEENGITDVLFCMNTFSAVGENADYLPGIT